MESHSVRNRYWGQSRFLEKIKLTLTGYSRAAYRTGFYIPELDIMLDAGPQNFNAPSHIFITHTHGDHIGELPFTMILDDAHQEMGHVFNLYGPLKSQKFVVDYINALFNVNAMRYVNPASSKRSSAGGASSGYSFNLAYRELGADDQVSIVCKNNQIVVDVIECDHSVPTVSYLFSTVKKKLREEFRGLSGREIVELKKQNIEITRMVKYNLFGFICDTSIQTIKRYEEQWKDYPYMIVECTFLYPDEEEQARKTKHIHWNDLKDYVIQYQNITWILIHFSLRYKDHEIRQFFNNTRLENIIPWVE